MNDASLESVRYAVLSGGVGGAKFAAGLDAILDTGELAVIVNTGDDFNHFGLRVCPDLDSVLYGLAAIQDESRGWGRKNETWNCLASLSEIGADDWFALGDRDLAVHLFRTYALSQGESLANITARMAKKLGVRSRIIPMTESHVSTILHTDQGALAFQDYFVRQRHQPRVQRLEFAGAHRAELHPMALAALTAPHLKAILIAPSNPFLSIDPILALPDVRERLQSRRVPVIAISPLIGGNAVKGPLADMLESMGQPRSSTSIADHYLGLIDGLVIDASDAHEAADIDLPILAIPTLMSGSRERESLARAVVAFATECANGR